jgi:hypothetical protein
MIRTSSFLALGPVLGLALALGGCGSGASPQQGLTTASILGEAPSAAGGEKVGVSNADPMARPVQVAWTAARAQKCGFQFDAARLKTNYLTSEARQGVPPPQLATYEKSYDTTFAKISSSIAGEQDYCSERKTAAIKTDLQRHLAGDYAPRLPDEKKVAGGGFFDGFVSEERQEGGKFSAKSFWEQQQAKKDGVRAPE